MALDFCHTALLHFVHIVLWVRLYLWTRLTRFISKHIGYLCIGEQRKLSAERCRIDSKNLPKLPLHIGLQILESRISDEDVANLLVWCIAMGFQYVSLFDDEGYFKKNPSKLRDVMQKKMATISESNRLVFHIETPVRNGERSYKVTTTKDTLQDTKSTRIALMSCEDGRGDILESARRLCQDVADNRYRASEIGITNLDQVMNSLLDYPDPELIIQFGQVNSLLGYSPWKIRVTEILSVPTHHGMNYQSFIDVLHSYSKTQQRYGK